MALYHVYHFLSPANKLLAAGPRSCLAREWMVWRIIFALFGELVPEFAFEILIVVEHIRQLSIKGIAIDKMLLSFVRYWLLTWLFWMSIGCRLLLIDGLWWHLLLERGFLAFKRYVGESNHFETCINRAEQVYDIALHVEGIY